jgi:hypothetical protein
VTDESIKPNPIEKIKTYNSGNIMSRLINDTPIPVMIMTISKGKNANKVVINEEQIRESGKKYLGT